MIRNVKFIVFILTGQFGIQFYFKSTNQSINQSSGGYLTREETGCAANLSTPCTLSHKKWPKRIPCLINILPKSIVARER